MQPGFDPSHVAAQGISTGNGFSGISTSNGFISLLTGLPGSDGGVQTRKLDGIIGRASNYVSGGYSNFAGQSSAAPSSSGTIAGVFRVNALSSIGVIFSSTGAGSGGYSLGYNTTTGNPYVFAQGAGQAISGLAMAAGIPYFLAASFSLSKTNFVLVSLNNGATLTDTQGTFGTAAASQSGTYEVGGNSNGGRSPNAIIAALMYAPGPLLSGSQLLQWASDPWSFWYPKEKDSAPWAA
jgi:hypothetical protein